GLGVAFGHIAKALAELFLAFQPLGQQFVAWLVQVTARFATWAATFAKSKAFTDFIAYVKSSGALFLSTLLAIGKGLWAIVHALAPFAGPLLKGIRGLFNLFASFPPTAFKALAVGIIAVIAIFGVLVVAVAAAVTAVVATLGLVIYVIARVVTAVISLVRHWRVAWNAVKKALSAVWHWMRGVFNTMKRWFPRTWRTIWTAVTRFFRAAWRAIRGALRAAWRWMKHTFHTISHWVTRTWRRLWNSVKHLFQAAWRAIRRIAGAIWRGLRSTFNTIRRGITSVWRRAWNTVTSVARRAWHSITSGVHRLWGGLRSAFRSGVNAIKSIWNRLKRVAKRPVNFIIGTVYNRGIRGLWNKVAGWVGLDNLKLGRVPLLASGDVVPASGTATAAARAIVGEGSNTHPEYVIPTDPKYRDRALDLYSSLGTRLMADGGILGGLKSFGSHVVGLFTHPVSTLENLLSGVLGKLDQIRTSPFGRAAAKIPGMIVEKLADKLKNSVGSFLGGFGAAASGPAVAIGRRMAAAMGWVGSQWNALKALWTRESSWNPYAVNPKSGAYGIPQSLGHGHPFALGDAVAQIRWGIGYILGRYTNPVNAWQHEVAYGWYDQGGLLPPGASVVYNGTGQSETVL
ncbi:MAG: hypothetical protein ACRDMV_15180, partial [Streptosporangiales bacterium]